MSPIRSSGEPVLSAQQIAQVLGVPPPTPEQRAVIEAPLSAHLVVAGAGSGKTETMAARVVWLVANRLVEPEEVLGLTFTRKAAAELGSRLARRLGALRAAGLWQPGEGTSDLGLPTVATYHSYAARLVGDHGIRIGLEPDTTLLTEAACWQIAADVVERAEPGFADLSLSEATLADAVLSLSGGLYEHLVEPEDLVGHLEHLIDVWEALPGRTARGPFAPVRHAVDRLRTRLRVVPLVQQYRDRLLERGAMDFAAQISAAAHLARDIPGVRRAERAGIRAVLLDEFQDTSDAQLTLLASIFGPEAPAAELPGSETVAGTTMGRPIGVTAVGDPHQSIYGWRGASATTLTRFVEQFRATGEVTVPTLSLSTSWRNDHAVLEVANRVAAPLRDRARVHVEPLRAAPSAATGQVHAARLLTEQDEAEYLARWVAQRWFASRSGTEPPTSGRPDPGCTAAVLCRRRSQFAPILAALRRQGLPVEVVGLGGLLSTAEVRDLVAVLGVAQEPTRGPDMMRLLTGPIGRLGAADLEVLWAWARRLAHRTTLGLRGAEAAEPEDPVDPAGGADPHQDRVDAVLADAVETPPPAGWTTSAGTSLSAPALARVRRIGSVVQQVRSLAAIPLPDLVLAAERALGADIEVSADPDRDPVWARAQVEAFVTVAEQFASSAVHPTLGGLLSWLRAAEHRERGLDLGEAQTSTQAVQVLTVHAAKGLEWDVVAVPGMIEGAFPSHAHALTSAEQANLPNLDPRTLPVHGTGWLTGHGALPYALRGDADGLPQLAEVAMDDTKDFQEAEAAFKAAVGDHQIAEERRLAYVAITRARSDLLMSAAIWGDGIAPKATSRFLMDAVSARTDADVAVLDSHAAVSQSAGSQSAGSRAGMRGVRVEVWTAAPKPGPDGAMPTNPGHQEEYTVPWPRDPERSRRAAVELVTAQLEARRLGRRSGAEPSGAEIPGEGLAGLEPDRRRRLELLVAEHQAGLEARSAAGSGGGGAPPVDHLSASRLVALAADPEEYHRRRRRPVPTAPSTAARQGTAFHAWVQDHFGGSALLDLELLDVPEWADQPEVAGDLERLQRQFLDSPWSDRVPEAIELDIETVVGGVPLRCRIDAVFREVDGTHVIVDWKTGREPSGAIAEHHALQLSAYRLAYCRLRGLDESQVAGAFFYAGTGRTVRPDLVSADELVSRVSELAGPTG